MGVAKEVLCVAVRLRVERRRRSISHPTVFMLSWQLPLHNGLLMCLTECLHRWFWWQLGRPLSAWRRLILGCFGEYRC